MRTHFRRDRLPDPAKYFAAEGLTIVGTGEWRSARCPFHHPDRDPSLRVRLASGSFRCMSCGEKGHDIVSFHQKQYGQDFVATAKALGAWEA